MGATESTDRSIKEIHSLDRTEWSRQEREQIRSNQTDRDMQQQADEQNQQQKQPLPPPPQEIEPYFPVVMFHNPECGTSRNVLHIIRSAGYEPVVIHYLTEGWTKPQLLGFFAAAGLTPKQALRKTKSPAKELGLLEPGVSDELLMEKMLEFPVLVDRPFVCTPKGVKLCRPSEAVLQVLHKMPTEPVFKEDGERVI